MNKAMLIGHLGKDPELRQLNRQNVCSFSLATDESYTDRDGNRVSKAEWHNIQVWGKIADSCSRYLHKGSQCYVEGRIQTRKWQDRDGNDRYTTEIKADRVEFLDKRDGNQDQGGQRDEYQPSEQNMDDLPF